MMNIYDYESPIGVLRLKGENGILHRIEFCDKKEYQDSGLEDTIHWLDCYFSKHDLPNCPKLQVSGTVFQMKVWSILLEIPYGEGITYGEIAKRFDGKMSAQAIGQAVGKNPIAIIIPCHRVLGLNKKITGYAGGLEKKRYLLDLENIEYKE